jgi:hypothetical protein
MIVREIQDYRVLDATSNTVAPQPLDYRVILAPLLYWRLELTERRITLLEPQSGSLGSPDPNAFMIIVPPSFTAGQLFGIELLDTDWESEGFAVGDLIDMGLGSLVVNSIFLRSTIRGISGKTATLSIDTVHAVIGTLDTQNPFPLVAFLVNERLNVKAALLRDGDFGFTSPLNGQPFYVSGHADSINITAPPATNSTIKYNLRLYNASQEAAIDGYMPNARNLKNVYIEISGTQFYAYRSSLNPTSNTPTQAYPTRGKIVIEGEAPNELRNLSFETECLLLHPNRIEETNNFVTPGTLTITPSGSSISAPSIPSPIKQLICLLGQDSHHSLPSVMNSLDLTAEIAPPSVPTASRAGADYVGVVVGQVGGKWVAAMTNRIPSAIPTYNLRIADDNLNPARYDCMALYTEELSARLTGTYIVMIYGKINGSFVQLASYDLNIRNAVSAPYPNITSATEALGNLFLFESAMPNPFDVRVANYDTIFCTKHPTLGNLSVFFIPIPSAQEAPNIGMLTQPPSGYLLDILPFLDSPPTIKAQLICPDGTLLESPPHKLLYTPRPDNQLANINASTSNITIVLNNEPPIKFVGEFYIRVAIFRDPADHYPIDQAMLYAKENYTTNTIINQYNQNGTKITITRSPLSGYSYQANINIAGLLPGQYNIHVRTEFLHEDNVRNDYESFYYSIQIPNPEEPSSTPLPQIKCKTEIPAIRGEAWGYITIRGNDITYTTQNLNTCSLIGYCGCFVFVPSIPDEWIDIIGYFKGGIRGIPVPNNSTHKARFRGRIIRLDDEYTTEEFVSSLYRQEDIVRAYATRYQVEIFAHTPCDLSNLDILKFAERWDIVNRSNRMLPDTIYNLRPAEISISDSGEHAKVTITLKTLKWRDEYRRQG